MKWKKININNLPTEEVVATNNFVYFIIGHLGLYGDPKDINHNFISCVDEHQSLDYCTHYILTSDLEKLEKE